MFHIYLIIVSLAGQPADILKSTAEYATLAECETARPPAVAEAKEQIETKTEKQFTVLDSRCISDADAKSTEPFDPSERHL